MRDGYYDGCGLLSVHLTTTDMNRIGRLILDKGIHNGKRIVPEAWIDAILHPKQNYATPWGFEPSSYALCYYHCVYEGKTLVYGLSWGGQFLVLVPDDDTVVTVNQNPDSPGALRQSIQFTSRLFALILKDLASASVN